MRHLRPITIAICAGLLAACSSGSSGNSAKGNAASGSGSSGNSSAAVAIARAAVSNDNATAEQVALAKRGDVSCPAIVKTPAPAAGTPVDDLEGVRPGITYDEAANLVMCSNPLLIVSVEGGGFQIQQYGYKVRQAFSATMARPIKLQTRQEYLHNLTHDTSGRMQPGDVKWNVSTMGLPGKERVIAVWRDQWYPAGKNPTQESVKEALIRKYGTPTRVDAQSYWTALCWTYDQQRAPVANACGSANVDGDIQVNSRSGTAIQAWIRPMDNNHALAQDVIVNVLDGGGGYAAIVATEKGLKEMDAQRRAAEVKKAAQNATAPQF